VATGRPFSALIAKTHRVKKFIVEMQKAKQNYFKDRSLYYSTFPTQSQAQKGDRDFELKSVYTVGLLDFVFDEDRGDDRVFHHEVQLFDKSTQAVFYEKLTYIYLEMPEFTKTLDELETHFENWLYILRHIEHLTDRPAKLQEKIFNKLFEQAEIANFNDDEYSEYEASLKTYRDLKNSINTVRDREGRDGPKRRKRRGPKGGQRGRQKRRENHDRRKIETIKYTPRDHRSEYRLN